MIGYVRDRRDRRAPRRERRQALSRVQAHEVPLRHVEPSVPERSLQAVQPDPLAASFDGERVAEAVRVHSLADSGALAQKRAANERYAQRRGRELHPGGRLCRPLPSYSATAPRIPTYQLAEVISMPHLLIAHRTRDDQTEAEPVLVETADSRILTFQLDDGERLEFDRAELAAALADLEPA